jgi:hypothetical protein
MLGEDLQPGRPVLLLQQAISFQPESPAEKLLIPA